MKTYDDFDKSDVSPDNKIPILFFFRSSEKR